MEDASEAYRTIHVEGRNTSIHFTEEEWERAEVIAEERGCDSVCESIRTVIREDVWQARQVSALIAIRRELEDLLDVLKERAGGG